MIKLTDLLNENWEVKDGKVLSNGKLIGYYEFDRDSDSFWIDDVKKSKGQLSFETKKEVEDYFKKNEKDALKHLGKIRESVNESLPGKGAVVSAKDIDQNMMDYFDRTNVKLEVTPISGNKYSASVGPQFGDLFFHGIGAPDKSTWKLQLKQIKSVKILGYYGD
jgi:hypothetical protein